MWVSSKGEKPVGPEERTNKLIPHMASNPGNDPGPHWWRVNVLRNHCANAVPMLCQCCCLFLIPQTEVC